jgi:hypothetical protein
MERCASGRLDPHQWIIQKESRRGIGATASTIIGVETGEKNLARTI